MSDQNVYPGWTQRIVTFASGATLSGAFGVAGYTFASIVAPAGLKGHLRCKIAHTVGATYVPVKDDTTTILTQTLAAVGKPCVVELRQEFLLGQFAKLLMTSATTAPKTVSVFTKA